MKYKLTKKQKKMRNRIIIAIALLAVTAVTLHFVEVPWWAELVPQDSVYQSYSRPDLR